MLLRLPPGLEGKNREGVCAHCCDFVKEIHAAHHCECDSAKP